jgi:hypothetical protein
LKPSLIIARKTDDEDALGVRGWTQDNCFIYSQRNLFLDMEIFNDWVKDTFVPELIDNCWAHRGDDFAGMCEENRTVPIFLLPQASNRFQPLTLRIFGGTKKVIRFNQVENRKVQTQHIVQILEGLACDATPMNIVSSFRNAGIET